MTVLAFWTSGQLFIHKAYVLLVFAGIRALMEGTVDIVRAFKTAGSMRSSSRPSRGRWVRRTQRKRDPDEINPSSRARSTASLRLCASSLE